MNPANRFALASIATLSLLSCDPAKTLEPGALRASTRSGFVNPPSGTSAIATSKSHINLSWQDNSDNEDGFEVYRSTAGPSGAFTLIARMGAQAVSFGDIGLTAATQYCCKVRAFLFTNGAGMKSSTFDAPACATTLALPTEPPPAPTSLVAYPYPFQIILSWSADPGLADGYVIERCLGSVCSDADFLAIATTQFGSYQDGTAADGFTYTYRVRAYNSIGQSAPSNEATVTACVVTWIDDYDFTYECSAS